MNSMETAPKDRRILVYVPSKKPGDAWRSGWFSAQWDTAWWCSGFVGAADEFAFLDEPIGWQELPSEPEQAAS